MDFAYEMWYRQHLGKNYRYYNEELLDYSSFKVRDEFVNIRNTKRYKQEKGDDFFLFRIEKQGYVIENGVEKKNENTASILVQTKYSPRHKIWVANYTSISHSTELNHSRAKKYYEKWIKQMKWKGFK